MISFFWFFNPGGRKKKGKERREKEKGRKEGEGKLEEVRKEGGERGRGRRKRKRKRKKGKLEERGTEGHIDEDKNHSFPPRLGQDQMVWEVLLLLVMKLRSLEGLVLVLVLVLVACWWETKDFSLP